MRADGREGKGSVASVDIVGTSAGLLVLALIAGAVVGAVWGSLRPGVNLTVVNGDVLVDYASGAPSVEFSALAQFAGLSALLGLVLALVSYARSRGRVSVFSLVWLLLAVAAAEFSLHTFDWWAVGLAHGSSAPRAWPETEMADGTSFTVFQPLTPGIAWLVGPFVASFTYWLGALVSLAMRLPRRPEDAPSHPSPR